MREAAGGKPEKEEKSRCRNGQGKNLISFTISQQLGLAVIGTREYPC